jgi:hypothetical protein
LGIFVAAQPAAAYTLKPYATTYVYISDDPRVYTSAYAVLDFSGLSACEGKLMKAKATWYIGNADTSYAYVSKVVVTAYTTSRPSSYLGSPNIYAQSGTVLWHSGYGTVALPQNTWVTATYYVNKSIPLGSAPRFEVPTIWGAHYCTGYKSFVYYLKRG